MCDGIERDRPDAIFTALADATRRQVIRTLSEQTRALVRAELPKVCEAIGAAHGCRVAFLHPAAGNGVLIELSEKS